MATRCVLLFGWCLLISDHVLAQEACAPIPPMYVGKWSGEMGTAEAITRRQTGTAVVLTEFGHSIDKFAFEVAPDGKVTGSGTATYRFRALTAANLLAAKVSAVAELEGKTQKVDFTISGAITRFGKLTLEAKPAAPLTLINAGKRQTMPAWDVFAGVQAAVEVSGGRLVADAFGVAVVHGNTTKIAWVAKSDAQVPANQKASLPAPKSGETIPKIWVGKWEGSGRERSKRQTKIGTADVLVDLGAILDEIVLDVADNGKVTGTGRATYWFDVSSDANLILARQAPYAHLEGNIQQVDFDVSGTMSADGKLKLKAAPRKDLKRIDTGGKAGTQGAWNVFGGIEATVQPGAIPIAKASGTVEALNMKIDWHVKRKALAVRGRVLHRIYVPKGNDKGNFIDINSTDWAKIGPRVVPPMGKVKVEAFLIEPGQKEETGDPVNTTDTDDHGCFQLLVPTVSGKTLRLRTTYANNEAILKEQCRIDFSMDQIMDRMERMVGASASEEVKGTERQTEVWVRWKGDLKKIDLGKEPRTVVLRKYFGEPFALEFNALNSILVNTFILKAPYASQNRNDVNLTGVHVPARRLWELLPEKTTEKERMAFRQRLGLGEKDEIPEHTTTTATIVGPEVCFPSSTSMAMGCLGKLTDAAIGIQDIGQGCYDYFYTVKTKAKPNVYPYAAAQYSASRWPYIDMPTPVTYSNNPKKWLPSCVYGGDTWRPWQIVGDAEPYLRGFVKNEYGVDSQYQPNTNVFASSHDGTVLHKLGAGSPALVSIKHRDTGGGEGGHGICLLGVVVDSRGNIKRWIFHDPYGDQTQNPEVEGYYGQQLKDKKGKPMGRDPKTSDVDLASAKGHRAGVKGRYAPYSGDINSYDGSIVSKYIVWWLNPETATPEKIRPRLLPSEWPLTATP